MASYKIEDTTLTNIADAIRSKTGETSSIRVDQMANAIGELEIKSNLTLRTSESIIELKDLTELIANGSEIIQLLINDSAVWSNYTNLISIATTEPGGIGLYNEVGYKDGCRWSSSSKSIKYDYANARVTGWMPFTPNATCRIKGFAPQTSGYVSDFYIAMFQENGTIDTVTYAIGSTKYPYEYDAVNDIATFTTNPGTYYKYFLVSSFTGDVAPIVTINEEIV
jgi:hypothetical protein